MTLNAPTAIQIELHGLQTKLVDKHEPDIEVLSAKKRLEMLRTELQNYTIWQRKNPEEYDELERGIHHAITEIEKMVNRNHIIKVRDNIVSMESQILAAINAKDNLELSKLEGILVSARMELGKFNENPVNKDLEEEAEVVGKLIKELKEKIEQFYLGCIKNVEVSIKYFQEVVSMYQGTRYEINFTKIHKLLERNIDELKKIDVKDRRSFITTTKKKVISELEEVRNSFNNKVYGNEEGMNSSLDKDGGNAELLKCIGKIEELQCNK